MTELWGFIRKHRGRIIAIRLHVSQRHPVLALALLTPCISLHSLLLFQCFSFSSLSSAVCCQPDVVVRIRKASLLWPNHRTPWLLLLDGWSLTHTSHPHPLISHHNKIMFQFCCMAEINLLILQQRFRFQMACFPSPYSSPGLHM